MNSLKECTKGFKVRVFRLVWLYIVIVIIADNYQCQFRLWAATYTVDNCCFITRWNHMVASMRASVLTPFENNCLKGIFFI